MGLGVWGKKKLGCHHSRTNKHTNERTRKDRDEKLKALEAVKVKSARFEGFVHPTDIQIHVSWGTRLGAYSILKYCSIFWTISGAFHEHTAIWHRKKVFICQLRRIWLVGRSMLVEMRKY